MNHNTPALNDAERQALQRATQAVQRETSTRLQALQSDEAVVHFITRLHQGVDAVVHAATQQGVQTACAAGCAHCCQARVDVTLAEVFLITRTLHERAHAQTHVQTHAPAREDASSTLALPALVQRLQAHAALLAKLIPATLWKDRPPCPFLQDQLCSIYSVRPAVCRKAHSLDVSACAAQASNIPQSLQIVVAAQAWISGTAMAYADQGLRSTPEELGPAVLHALTDVSAEACWLDGKALRDSKALPDGSATP